MSYPRLTKCMPDETRPNPFHMLHKALRFGHCRMLMELGAQEFGDDTVAARLLAQLDRHLDLYRAIAEARQKALLSELTRHGLELEATVAQDHAGHLAALGELASLVRAVHVAAPQRRRPAGRSIYRCYALYTSSDMARMDEEETMLLGALHSGLADDALHAIEGRCFAGLGTEHFDGLIRLLLPALSTAELEQLLGMLQRHLDPHLYESTVEPVIRPLLATGRPAAA